MTQARLYHCARCRRQVVICRRCDRGNLYCSPECSQQARTQSLRRADKKYRTTRQGRLANAARQQRFRQRRQKNVTDQGSIPNRRRALLHLVPSRSIKSSSQGHAAVANRPLRCCICGCECDDFVRLEFLRGYRFTDWLSS